MALWLADAKCLHGGCPYEASVAVLVPTMWDVKVTFCCPRHLVLEVVARSAEAVESGTRPVHCDAADLDGALAAAEVLSS